MCEPSSAPLLPPSPSHLLGTDPIGRDALCVLTRASLGSLLVGLSGSTSALALLTLSALAGAAGAWPFDLALGTLLALPRLALFVFLALVVKLSPLELGALVGLLASVPYAKALYARGRQLAEEPFFQASLAAGSSRLWASLRHCLPHCYEELLEFSSLAGAFAIYAESGLSALGLEGQGLITLGKEMFLILATPGALLTPAGQVQALVLALATVALGEGLRQCFKALHIFARVRR